MILRNWAIKLNETVPSERSLALGGAEGKVKVALWETVLL